jgi:hypothetical protein
LGRVWLSEGCGLLYQEETFDTAGVVDAHLALVECFKFGF